MSATTSEWSKGVVVRNSSNDANDQRAVAVSLVSTGGGGASSTAAASKGAIQPYTTVDRQVMSTSDQAPHQGFLSLITPSSSDMARTFWKPSPERHEVGLLEALHRRTAANATFMLVSSRPPAELQCNFSLNTGECINLDCDLFKLSKTHAALRSMEQVHDDMTLDGRALKTGMRQHLPELHHDDHYLVRYRDYSDWAVNSKEYKARAKRDTTLGPKYVEQCFAIRTGQNPGVFIPITEPQFIFGCELLDQQRLTATPAQIASKAVNLFALNSDQFRSVSTIAEPVTNNGTHNNNNNAHSGHSAYMAPSPWDWTPTAIEKRINHFMEQQYRSVGRLVVKGALVGLCLYFFVQFVRRGTGLNDRRGQQQQQGDRRASRYSNNARRRGAPVEDVNEGSVIGSVLRGVFFTGPKEVFDFLLGGGGSTSTSH